jgi:hypothetical protein
MKAGHVVWCMWVLVLGCRPARVADDGDATDEDEGLACEELCAPAWCLSVPGSMDHWVAIVGLVARPNGNIILLSVAADETRELVEFTPQGTVVSTLELEGEGTPRAVASGPEGIYVATSMGSLGTSAVEHFSYGGDLVWAQPIERTALNVSSIALHNGVFALAGTINLDSEDLWVGMLDMTGTIRWEHTYDHAGFTDDATSVVFDGKTVAVAGNVQHAPPANADSPWPIPNFVYFATYAAADGAMMSQEIITGENAPVDGILEVSDLAQFEDGHWALVGTSTQGLIQSVWWTAIVDIDGVRIEKYEAEVGDNVTEAVATFGDAVLVAGRRGDPLPTTTRVIRHAPGVSSLAWEWIDALPDDDARDIVGDMLVVDSNLYVSSVHDLQPLQGGTNTESLTVCSFPLF